MKNLLLIVLLMSFAVSEAVAFDSGWITKMIRTGDGLSNDYVQSVAIGEDGTVWIGTEEGMNSFDGVRIKSYTKSMGAVPGNALNDVLPDVNGEIVWVATQRSGLGWYNWSTGDAAFFSCNPADNCSLACNEVTHVEQDSEGNLWFSTYRRGLEKYDVSSGKFIHYNASTVEGMEDYSIIDFAIGNDGRLYLGHYEDGLTVLDPASMTAYTLGPSPRDPNSLPSGKVGCVYRDQDNNIWVGTALGLALYNPVTDNFRVFNSRNSGLPDRLIYSVLVTRDRHIYVSPNFSGLWVADLEEFSGSPRFVPFAVAEEIADLPVEDMCEDSFGNLWIGSYGRGVLFVGCKSPAFSMMTAPEMLSAKNVTAVLALNDGRMVIGMHGGIDILDRDLFDSDGVTVGRLLPDRTVTGLYQDSAGEVWMGTFGGRTVIADSNFARRQEIDINEARCFIERNDTIWVGTGSGLYAVDRSSKRVLANYSDCNILPENYLRCLCTDWQGNLWVGTFGSGILVFDGKMRRKAVFNTANGLHSDLISALLPVGDRVYAATGEGLVCFGMNEGQWEIERIVTMEDGISSDAVKALVLDAGGGLWFSTNLSVCLMDMEDGKVTEFNNRGFKALSTGNFNGNSCTLTQDGHLFFGSTEGLLGFDPEEFATPLSAPEVSFKDFIIYTDQLPAGGYETRRVAPGEVRKISWKQNNFGLTFSVDDYSLSEFVHYFVRLDNGPWYAVEDAQIIRIRDIPSGKHSVTVKARILNGEFGPSTVFNLGISWPLWWCPVSWVLYVLLAMGAAWMVVLHYHRRREKENSIRMERESMALAKEANEERIRFYTNITHELRTPLTLIVGPAADLDGDSSLPESARKKISTLNLNVKRLLELVNRLLDFRKAETSNYEISLRPGDISAVAEQTGRIFFDSITNPSVTFRMDISPGVNGVFDAEVLTVILNNLLSNAFKFTKSGVICLSLNPLTVGGVSSAEIIVSDTGCGIPGDQLDRIFDSFYRVKDAGSVSGTGIGLSLVKRLVKLHRGTIEVESEPGRGSYFRVILPLENPDYVVKEAQSSENEASPLPEAAEISENERKTTVVVAEDNEDIRNYISSTLQEDGFVVYAAEDGSKAYSRIAEVNPDLIVSDIMMPVLDGLALCRKVRQDIRFSHIPVILLTAKGTIGDRDNGYKAGADSYLVKPFTGELLKTRVRNILETRKRLASRFSSTIGNVASMQEAESLFNEKDNKFMKMLTAVVEEHMASETLDVAFLAERMNMSNSTLYRKLKSLTGLSANEFIRKKRMHKARELMSAGGCNVSEAAWSVGIGSMIYFRQCFMNEFGVLPSEFRRSQRKGTTKKG